MITDYSKNQEPTRQKKASELIKRELSIIFAKGKGFTSVLFDKSITISSVKISNDLKNAKIYLLMFGDCDKNVIMQELNNIKYIIRKDLTKKINLKFSPELSFFWDDSFDHAARINKLLSESKSQ